MNIANREYSRQELEKRIGNLKQLGGIRHYIINEGKAKGVSAADFNTGSGFRFTVLPDRGLDISNASYQGINLVYLTPNGEVHPSYYEPAGNGWLRNFFGGLLTTCGLTYFGPPGQDEGRELGLHGRYTNIPAKQVNDRSRWEENDYILEISGIVEECSFFGHKLRLTRTISTRIGEKALSIKDTVKNFGYKRAPLTVLYHINSGFPLLANSSKLVLSAIDSIPEDEISRQGTERMTNFSEPLPDFREQNYLHKIAGDRDGYGFAALINKGLLNGLGLYIKFKTDNLPYLNQWKMMGEGEYVVGLEPCNVKCVNRAILRKEGTLPYLEPGEKKEMELTIGILEGKQAIADFCNKLKRINRI